MSSPPTIEPFKGTSWEECDDFIRAIRAAAWKEGKIRDPSWIADFASLHFSRKALLWYSRLPQDIREDWAELQVALLERWTPPDDDDEPRIEPTPAAAPSPNRSDKAERPLQGALKAAVHGSNTNYYVQLGGTYGIGVMTMNANEAIRIRCNSLSNTTLLERIDGSRHSWLAVQWRTANPNLKTGSTECAWRSITPLPLLKSRFSFGFLVLVDSLTLKSSWDPDYPYQPAPCTLSTDGEVIPVWENEETGKITIGIFRDLGGILCVAADPDAYSELYPDENKVKFFIEPID